MSDSESDHSNEAIVVGKTIMKTPNAANKSPTNSDAEKKMCSACRNYKLLKEFVGATPRHEGQEMRTCIDCRMRNRKMPVNESVSLAKTMFENNKSGRNGRITRRKTLSTLNSPTRAAAMSQLRSARSAATAAAAAAATTAAAAASPQADSPVRRTSRPRRSSLTVATPALTVPESPVPEATHDDSTDTEEELSSPSAPLLSPSQTLKRHSTSPLEDMNGDAIQVRPPPAKRQRMAANPTTQRQVDVEEAGPHEEVEEEEPTLNANGHPVGSDLAAFATSLGRLSHLLINAGKHLDSERIGALESEIHHDWRVDEMATFVEGFLKGASANAVGKTW